MSTEAITSQSAGVILENAHSAHQQYSKLSGKQKAVFLETIAASLETRRQVLVQTAMEETNLPEARLNGELSRTTNQLKMFARLVGEGSWVEAAIDTADAQRVPPKPDTRKMLVALGPVIVFGASNFPFAFSTAGGDTASALAAGCAVVIKAHFAHPKTSIMAFEAMQEAIATAGLPVHTVQHVAGDNLFAKELVIHHLTAAVTFTGSLAGGRALYDYAVQRKKPIPVFAEMSSINPVVIYPDALATEAQPIAKKLAASFMLGAGQFCTKPGLLLMVKSNDADLFIETINETIEAAAPQKMLHKGIANAYINGLQNLQTNHALTILNKQDDFENEIAAKPLVAITDASVFMNNETLQHELFGPYALVVVCKSKDELLAVLQSLEGQLTSTLMATEKDVVDWSDVVNQQSALAGRIILNEVPTGVEVNASMVHGGAYPATTDARFTSVGSSAIKRFVRPVCFQGFANSMLPLELQHQNPLGIWRTLNNEFTKTEG